VTKACLAKTKRSGGPSGGSVIHLIRRDAEALCGISTASLAGVGMFDKLVCAACLEWFEKRRAASGSPSKVRSHDRTCISAKQRIESPPGREAPT
jgi:hypothetical protein